MMGSARCRPAQNPPIQSDTVVPGSSVAADLGSNRAGENWCVALRPASYAAQAGARSVLIGYGVRPLDRDGRVAHISGVTPAASPGQCRS